MAGTDSLTDQIRGWFERTPKAQRAVKRLSEDLDIVASHVEKATSGLMEKVAPIIDPPASVAAPNPTEPTAASSEGDAAWTGFSSDSAERPSDAAERKESTDREPVDPTA